MKTTNQNKDRQAYSTMNLSLAQQLYKEDDFSGLMLHLYIGARRNLRDGLWEFNIPDIAAQTGVDRRVLAKQIRKLQSEAVFIPAGITSKGACKFTLNQQEYNRRYVTVSKEGCASNEHQHGGLCALHEHSNELACTSNAHTSSAQSSVVCASNVHAGVHSMNTPCASNEHPDVHSMQGGCALDVHQDVHSMYTKNNNKEEEEETRQKDREKETQSSLPASLSASRFSEVTKDSVNPFSQPMFVEDPDRPAQRNDSNSSKVTEPNKSANVTGLQSRSDRLQKPGQSAEQSDSGKVTVSGSSLLTDTKPYNYTIAGQEHEIFFDAQEENITLPPVEKVTVLKRSLVPFITTGDVDVPRACVMQVNGKSFELARQLFELNPALPVSGLLKVIWECNRVACENPVKESGYKPCFTHRAATESLTYLLKNLDMINGTMPRHLWLPENTQYLTVA